MQPTVYLETTIISYLTARPTREVSLAAKYEATKDWWESSRASFRVVVSALVLQEASRGDAEAAQRRLATLQNLELLEIRPEMEALARELCSALRLPQKAEADAVHIAIAAMSGITYLLTWNCRHIANATFRPRIAEVCQRFNCVAPVICTPLELFEEHENDL